MSTKMLSLFDYLGYPAGKKLGAQVAAYATIKKTKHNTRYISTPNFTGEVILYTKEFLDDYFKDSNYTKTNTQLMEDSFEIYEKENKKNMNRKQAVLSLSGGLDSSTLLLHLLANNYEVTALSFDYGQKHRIELERATDLVSYINAQFYKEGEVYGKVKHQIIKLDGLQQLLNSALVEGGQEVPEGHYEQENMKETVVPNRNKIFSSIIQAVALSIATKGEKKEVRIALGIHAGDHAIYPDCRQEFRDRDDQAFVEGNWDAYLVKMYTPYLLTDKFGILQDGLKCCKELGLDFDEVYKRTNTSYKPIWIPTSSITDNSKKDNLYGKWYSDYKSASSVERIEAFIKLGRPDPVAYADLETGPVTWQVAKKHVEKVLEKAK